MPAVSGELVTQASYARHRGVSRCSVWRRTVTNGGPIAVHGPRKLIDVAEADRLWTATLSPQGMANTHTNGNGKAAPSTGGELARARAAAVRLDVEVKRLALARLRGELVSRDGATRTAFAFGRVWRDRWLAWPARVGPQLALQFDVDAGALTVALERAVHEHLTELADERAAF